MTKLVIMLGTASVALCSAAPIAMPTVVQAAQQSLATVDFRTTTITGADIPNARIIVVGPDGKMVKSGLTNQSGTWRVTLPYQSDARFKGVRDMGMVTAIAIATGYNERVVFEVPVQKHAVEPIMMTPVRSNHRNEPTMTVGSIHRHDLSRMINAYAEKVGLKRQDPIPGEQDYAPWSPDLADTAKEQKTKQADRGDTR